MLVPRHPCLSDCPLSACCACPACAMQVTTGSDVYSYGVLMWCLYTGENPYLCERGLLVPNKRFPLFPDPTPPLYKQLAERCLQRDPHDRPTFAEISARLVALCDPGPSIPMPAGPPRPALLDAEPQAAATATITIGSSSDEGDSRAISYCDSRSMLLEHLQSQALSSSSGTGPLAPGTPPAASVCATSPPA